MMLAIKPLVVQVARRSVRIRTEESLKHVVSMIQPCSIRTMLWSVNARKLERPRESEICGFRQLLAYMSFLNFAVISDSNFRRAVGQLLRR